MVEAPKAARKVLGPRSEGPQESVVSPGMSDSRMKGCLPSSAQFPGLRVKELKKALLLMERVRRTRFGHRLGPHIRGRRPCLSVGVIVIRSTAATGSIFFVISHPAAELVGLVQQCLRCGNYHRCFF